jgi:hypothetical protein
MLPEFTRYFSNLKKKILNTGAKMAAMFLSLLVLMSYGSNYTIVSNTTYNDEAVFSNVIQSDYKEIYFCSQNIRLARISLSKIILFYHIMHGYIFWYIFYIKLMHNSAFQLHVIWFNLIKYQEESK